MKRLIEYRQALILARRLGARFLKTRVTMLLISCVLLGSSIAASLGFFAGSVQDALNKDVAEFLGAPLVIQSKQSLPPQWWTPAKELRSAQTASFTTGAVGPEHYHSVALKAVSPAYPVQGKLQIQYENQTAQVIQGAPQPGTAWLDRRAMAALGANFGDTVQLGRAQFLVAAELLFEPDRLTQLQHTLPRIMISLSELDNVGLDLTSGRGDFRYLFSGSEADLEKVELELPKLTNSSYAVLKPGEGSHPFSRMSVRASRFLGLVSVLVLVLCGGAAAILADFVVRRFVMTSAVLRCLGAERRIVTWAVLIQLGGVAVVAGAMGTISGWLIQPLLAQLLEPHMTLTEARFHLPIAFGAVGTGMITIIAFVLPRLTALGRVPIVSALRNQADWSTRNIFSVLVAAFFIALLLWAYSDNLQLTAMLSAGVTGVIIFATAFGWGLGRLTGQIHRMAKGSVKVALRAIGRSAGSHIAPMATIALAVMAFLMTFTLRGSFIERYNGARLEHDGNYLFTNLPATAVDAFNASVLRHQGAIAGLYPAVRANLVAINGVPIDQALSHESDTREETRSPVRLSWAAQLPDNNVLHEGAWPQPGSGDVSVDAEVMSDLNLALGDELRFQIGNRLFNTRISSRRGYKGGGSSVMFWFMFAPDALAGFKHSYMGGINVKSNAGELQRELLREFPDILITDLEQHISRVRNIMNAITRVMDSMMYLLVGAASVVVLASALISSAARRKR
ncbi:MAG: hypothetical protein MJA83_04970, partial [Gammaproteobacteria bacterium]|nr:hypothetical protein [Gammaproteobacteria bacterium]